MLGRNKIKIIGIIVALLTVGGVLFCRISFLKKAPGAQKIQEDNMKLETPSEINISDWLVYENKEYGYRFKYPRNWEYRENTIDTSIRGETQVMPFDLDNFPECQRRGAQLLEDNRERLKSHESSLNSYSLPSDFADPISVYNDTKATSCSLGIRAEKNPKQLSVKEFLKEKFSHSSLREQKMLDYIESLPAEKEDGLEKVILDKLFYYVGGFGGKDGMEGPVPYFSADTQRDAQIILGQGGVVIFVNNLINKEDFSSVENKDIFKNLVGSFQFLQQ